MYPSRRVGPGLSSLLQIEVEHHVQRVRLIDEANIDLQPDEAALAARNPRGDPAHLRHPGVLLYGAPGVGHKPDVRSLVVELPDQLVQPRAVRRPAEPVELASADAEAQGERLDYVVVTPRQLEVARAVSPHV